MTKPKQEAHELSRDDIGRLTELVKLLLDMEHEELRRKDRLLNEPQGFPMAGEGRDCWLCHTGVCHEDGWYDKYGFKCMACQNAVNKKIIPGSLCGDWHHKKCISAQMLAYKTNLHPQTIRKLIRHGKIKARQILDGACLVLYEDNPNLNAIIQKARDERERPTDRVHYPCERII